MSIEVTGRDLDQWVGKCMVQQDSTGNIFYVYGLKGDRKTILRVGSMEHSENDRIEQRTSVPQELLAKEVSIWWPDLGTLTQEVRGYNFAVYVTRVPDRQYRRSYNSKGVSIEALRSFDVRQEIGFVPRLSTDSPQIIQALKNPNYPSSLDEATQFLNKKENLSVAFNRNIALYFDGVSEYFVYYRGEYVADLTRGGKLTCYKGGTIQKRLTRALGLDSEHE
ncbi:MAG: hypothetical protein QF535_18260 [Anaerolineales bacterium]|jgi:hypothetical protein|nr:hypothetical protein [Anaerolineales bacterium]